VTARIAVADVAGQVEFLRSVFGGVGEVHDGRPAEIVIGDSMVMVGPTIEREPFPAFVRDPYGNLYQIAHRIT